MKRFGKQTVGFITLTPTGPRDSRGLQELVESTVEVKRCRCRPYVSGRERESRIDETDVTTEMWKVTAPPEAAAIAAKSTGRFTCDGKTYEIDGTVMPKPDPAGGVHHVTIFGKLQAG